MMTPDQYDRADYDSEDPMNFQPEYPLICKCGFNTMHAREALEHIKQKHPKEWARGEIYSMVKEGDEKR